MTSRVCVLVVCLLAGAAYTSGSPEHDELPARAPLHHLSMRIQSWSGNDLPSLPAEVTAVLGADEYVNRVYTAESQPPVAVYIAFYRSQRQGETMHSPLNCLPGSGWQPLHRGYQVVHLGGSLPSSQITVNRVVVEKGLDRQLVLYWYQAHGRTVASEYQSKAFMIADALRLNRTDGAIVRVSLPITAHDATAEARADLAAARFIQAMYPLLESHIP